MTARLYHLPAPEVRRALEEIAVIGALAIDDLAHDCARWHDQRQAVINGLRNPYMRRASA
jgi:hypothetical protein